MRRDVTPRRRRRLARLQHRFWIDAQQWPDLCAPLPLQLYKRLRRIDLPLPRIPRAVRS